MKVALCRRKVGVGGGEGLRRSPALMLPGAVVFVVPLPLLSLLSLPLMTGADCFISWRLLLVSRQSQPLFMMSCPPVPAATGVLSVIVAAASGITKSL